ncbi:4,5-DOPA dioxygenase extradiol [Dermatophilus congolensis]|uniref:4,5-DOPA-extradiol-dioxygenase n=1 Tax=Dermatophilus congolensis TaxID=1863 RepID=UPI001AAF8669|nr:4,5-DOPA dioxygenase extradiol [Dermatophilus congolensis]
MSSLVMPAAFVGHGSPMNALERNRYTQAWRQFGASVPRPRAVLVVSAHWYINATAVTAMPQPRTIHDFYGFPQELFDIDYPAPGLPDLADEVAEIAKPTWVGADEDSWGIDHGTWSVLVHAFPDASIPVVQLSIDAGKPPEYHVDLGAKLATLRSRGVLILTSGNVVHNLRAIDWDAPNSGFDWAQRFDEAAKSLLFDRPSEIVSLSNHRDYGSAVPTPDHFIPLMYFAGLAERSEKIDVSVLVDGYSYGALSMAAYTLGMTPVEASDGLGAAPVPAHVPAEATNL